LLIIDNKKLNGKINRLTESNKAKAGAALISKQTRNLLAVTTKSKLKDVTGKKNAVESELKEAKLLSKAQLTERAQLEIRNATTQVQDRYLKKLGIWSKNSHWSKPS
jgi:hypothetical protein